MTRPTGTHTLAAVLRLPVALLAAALLTLVFAAPASASAPAADPARAALIAEGEAIFQSSDAQCASCHGEDGRTPDGMRHDVGSRARGDQRRELDTPSLSLRRLLYVALSAQAAERVGQPVRMAAHFDLSRFRNPPPQLAALVATPSPQEDDMPDSKKASPRKASLDESATPQAVPPETSADDTATRDVSAPAEIAPAEPALTPAVASQPAVAGATRPAEPLPRAIARCIDLDAAGAGERRATRAYVSEVHEVCALAGRNDLSAGFIAKATPVAQIRRALLEARAAEDEATAIRGQVRSPTVDPTQPAIDTAAIYAARNQNVR